MKPLLSLEALIEAFHKLPGVGLKSAERMAYSVLDMSHTDVTQFIEALAQVDASIHPCPKCGIYTEADLCEVCRDNKRDHHTLLVVSYVKDVYAFEKLESSPFVYHVLGGVLSAVKGIGVEDLSIDALLSRVEKEGVKEVILATNPTIEGETTALFISKLLEPYPVKVTRLAYGLPMGGHLDYADTLTLSRSLANRTKLKGE
jgi:recombination protein RecR